MTDISLNLRYERSKKDLESLRRTPLTIVAITTIFFLLIAFAGLSSPNPSNPIGQLIFFFLGGCGFCYLKIRQARKTLTEASSSGYILTDEGIVIESLSGNILARYSEIYEVKITRSVFNKKITQISLKNRHGRWASMSLEKPELFLAELRQRMASEDCIWS